jgi:hypothetical protein
VLFRGRGSLGRIKKRKRHDIDESIASDGSALASTTDVRIIVLYMTPS